MSSAVIPSYKLSWTSSKAGFWAFKTFFPISLKALARTHCCRHKYFPVCPRAATFVADINLCPGHKKCFWFCSETFRVPNKCFPVCAAQETSWETMCPQQCVLVYQGLKMSVYSFHNKIKKLTFWALNARACQELTSYVKHPYTQNAYIEIFSELPSENWKRLMMCTRPMPYFAGVCSWSVSAKNNNQICARWNKGGI